MAPQTNQPPPTPYHDGETYTETHTETHARAPRQFSYYRFWDATRWAVVWGPERRMRGAVFFLRGVRCYQERKGRAGGAALVFASGKTGAKVFIIPASVTDALGHHRGDGHWTPDVDNGPRGGGLLYASTRQGRPAVLDDLSGLHDGCLTRGRDVRLCTRVVARRVGLRKDPGANAQEGRQRGDGMGVYEYLVRAIPISLWAVKVPPQLYSVRLPALYASWW